MLQAARTSTRQTPLLSTLIRRTSTAAISSNDPWSPSILSITNYASPRQGRVMLELQQRRRLHGHSRRWQSVQSQSQQQSSDAAPSPSRMGKDIPPPGYKKPSTISKSGGSSSVPASTASSSMEKTGITDEKQSPSTSTSVEKGKDKEVTSSPSSSSKAVSSKTSNKPAEPLTTRIWAKVKHEAQHYWAGSKLLGKEIRISARLQMKLLRGKSLTRREKRQLKRTTQDLLRLIPFIPFVIIPFMEFLLPVALKLFPNMLPSTFEDKHAADEKKRKLLKVRLEMAKFLQETIRESGLSNKTEQLQNSEEFKRFFRKVRSTGEEPSTDEIVKVARLFEDDLTLDNLSRPQLVSMCRYMNINAFGTDNFLRYTIRQRLADLGRDDKLIDAEGVDSLSPAEIAHACVSRGIRTTNSSPERQSAELAQWIDLHLHHNLSGVLLILSKAFAFTERPDGTVDHLESLKDTLSSLPDTLLNETELQVSSEEGFKQRLEVLQQQEELIEDEAEQEQEEEEARKARKLEQLEAEARLASEEDALKEKEKAQNELQQAQDMLPEQLAAETVEDKKADSKKDARMTTEQLSELGEALRILSAKSSVKKEREDLAKLMEESVSGSDIADEAVASASANPDGSEATTESGETIVKEERKVSALEKRIRKMIGQIDEQLEAYDAEVSHKLEKFDCPEGKISKDNLRTAFMQIRHRPDDETIDALIEKLDVDNDGFVPLEDVTSLAEVEGIGVVIDDAAGELLDKGHQIRQDEGLTSTSSASASSASEEKKESKKSKPKREEIVE